MRTGGFLTFAWSLPLAVMLLGAQAAEGIPVTNGMILPAGGVGDSTGWEIKFDPLDPKITLIEWTPNAAWDSTLTSGANSIQGTLTISEEFKDFKPLVFTFKDTDPTADEFGLRFLLVKTVKNSTTDWTGFSTILSDTNVGEGNFGETAHPPTAHFHGGSILAMGADGLTDTRLASGANPFNGLAAKNQFFVEGGTLENGETEQFQVGVHDWRVQGKNRTFTMTETPIPEPALLGLLSSGLAVTTLTRWFLRQRLFSRR